MPRRVFFSFHYEDIWRVSQVRKSGVVRSETSSPQPIDHASWEAIRRRGERAVKNWINEQMRGAGVTVVLIGSKTSKRRYCLYEIEESIRQKKGIVGIHINKIKDPDRKLKRLGPNPLRLFKVNAVENYILWESSSVVPASEFYKTYDWVADNGYENYQIWVEEAARASGR